MIISGKINKIYEERGKPILIEVKIKKIEAKILTCKYFFYFYFLLFTYTFLLNFLAEEYYNLFENYPKDDPRKKMKQKIIEDFEENLRNYFLGIEDLTEYNIIGLITKYEVNYFK